jgi:hypothetical protein
VSRSKIEKRRKEGNEATPDWRKCPGGQDFCGEANNYPHTLIRRTVKEAIGRGELSLSMFDDANSVKGKVNMFHERSNKASRKK